MRYKLILLLLLPMISCLFLAPEPVLAQESIGYNKTADVSALLEYRLPSWSYRLWDVGFSFDGGGYKLRTPQRRLYGNNFRGLLNSGFMQGWDSEQRFLRIEANVESEYSGSHSGSNSSEGRRRSLRGQYTLGAEVKQYLGSSLFSVQAKGKSFRQYRERSNNSRSVNEYDDDEDFHRYANHEVSAGVGWGHIRDVVPLLRAQRLSSRLVALERPALTNTQVQEIAKILSTEYGYRAVFDRHSRPFWDDVLTPMLEPGSPLTPYEILYLMEVLNEDLSGRKQGFEIST